MAKTSELKNILLVEDDDKDAELIISALRAKNIINEIDRMSDGAEAISYLKKIGAESSATAPSLVLLDLKLPKVGGHEVLEYIKSSESLKNLPVVVLSSSKEEQDLLKSYSLHANAYVVKPLNAEDFLAAVNEIGMFWAVLNEPPPA